MKQIKEPIELVGKTIQRTAYFNNNYCLFFNDKTFCIFRGSGYDENDVELMDEDYDTNPSFFNMYELYELGFISKLEHYELSEKYKEVREQEEIARLKQLKEKYPHI